MTFEEYIKPFITPNRWETIQRVASSRTNYLTVVLEDVFQAQNASAVLRSCECFGIQNVYTIENYNNFEVNPKIVMGASKWVDVSRYNSQNDNNTINAIADLKKKGYRVVATSPHNKGVSLPDLDLSKGKMALIFGTELTGITSHTMDLADEYVTIPMYGFTESLNISVCAAIAIQNIIERLKVSDIDWQMSPEEKKILLTEWYIKSIPHAEVHIRNYNNNFID